MMDPSSPLAHRHAGVSRSMVDDRRQLAELDYRVARLVAEMLTGDGGVRALRHAGWRRMRRDWGLRSLVQLRNGGPA